MNITDAEKEANGKNFKWSTGSIIDNNDPIWHDGNPSYDGPVSMPTRICTAVLAGISIYWIYTAKNMQSRLVKKIKKNRSQWATQKTWLISEHISIFLKVKN